MYQIMKNGTSIGLTEQPTYVEPLDNGSYGLCGERLAKGIAYEGRVYALEGRGGMEGLETVALIQTDAGQVIRSQDKVQSILFVTAAEQGAVDDVTAAEHPDLFAPWASGIAYTVGNIRRYGGALYRCVTAHTSQDDWTPDQSASLWSQVADPSEEWPAWSQPIGAHDTYMTGDKVSYEDKHWVSTVDDNVWTPGAYGWEEVTE